MSDIDINQRRTIGLTDKANERFSQLPKHFKGLNQFEAMSIILENVNFDAPRLQQAAEQFRKLKSQQKLEQRTKRKLVKQLQDLPTDKIEQLIKEAKENRNG